MKLHARQDILGSSTGLLDLGLKRVGTFCPELLIPVAKPGLKGVVSPDKRTFAIEIVLQKSSTFVAHIY